MGNKPKETKSAGGVVVNRYGEILVVNQKGTSWSLPKGHIDEGEDAITAAKREIYEESGITALELIKELGSYQRYKIAENGGEDKSEWKTIIMFLFRTNQDYLKPVDPENPEAKWVERSKVADLLTHPKDKEFFFRIVQNMKPKKDFQKWHNKKRKIDDIKKRPFFHEREIWFCYLGVNVGFEQDGFGDDFLRPIVIFKKFNNEIFWGIPLTKKEKNTEYYFTFSFPERGKNTAILSQIRLIDARRLSYYIGEISGVDFKFLKDKLKALLP